MTFTLHSGTTLQPVRLRSDAIVQETIMKAFAKSWTLTLAALLCLSILGRTAPASAEYETSAVQDATQRVLEQVVYGTALAAHEEARRATSQFPDVSAARALPRLSPDARAELYALRAAHDRSVEELETRLYRKLTTITRAFQREASFARTPGQVWEMRYDLERQVARAYARFETKFAETRRRFDAMRAQIVGTG